MDLRTREIEHEVQNIIDLQRIANELLEAFTNPKGIMKSHIPAVNASKRIEIPNEVDKIDIQIKSTLTPFTQKRGRQGRRKETGAATRNRASGRCPKRLKKRQNGNENENPKECEGTPPVVVPRAVEPSENVYTNDTHNGKPEIPNLNETSKIRNLK